MIDNINRRRASAYSWHQLGTRCTVMGTGPGDIRLAAALVQGELALLDRTCSRFRSDTELAEVTRGRWSEVSALLFSLISAAIRSAELSDGAVDPTVDLARLGYDRDLSLVQLRYSPAEDRRAGPLVLTPGWRGIGLNASSSQVFLPEGVDLDLGSSAKAWAADQAATTCAEVFGDGFLVNLGGDIATAGPGPADGWQVMIEESAGTFGAGQDLGAGPVVSLHHGGLATSSTVSRTWRQGGRLRHHIIDPSTGEPAEPVWRTVSVAAASAELANTASTAAVVFGEQAPLWLTERGIAARLAPTHGPVRYTCGWPVDREPGARPADNLALL